MKPLNSIALFGLVLSAAIGPVGCACLKPKARHPDAPPSTMTASQLEAEIQATLTQIQVEQRLIARSKELLGQDLSPEMERQAAVARERIFTTDAFVRAQQGYLRALRQRLEALETERSFYHGELFEDAPEGPRRKPVGGNR